MRGLPPSARTSEGGVVTLTVVTADKHVVDVYQKRTALYGVSFVPVCSCGFQGGHYMSVFRARSAGQEHKHRHKGKRNG